MQINRMKPSVKVQGVCFVKSKFLEHLCKGGSLLKTGKWIEEGVQKYGAISDLHCHLIVDFVGQKSLIDYSRFPEILSNDADRLKELQTRFHTIQGRVVGVLQVTAELEAGRMTEQEALNAITRIETQTEYEVVMALSDGVITLEESKKAMAIVKAGESSFMVPAVDVMPDIRNQMCSALKHVAQYDAPFGTTV